MQRPAMKCNDLQRCTMKCNDCKGGGCNDCNDAPSRLAGLQGCGRACPRLADLLLIIGGRGWLRGPAGTLDASLVQMATQIFIVIIIKLGCISLRVLRPSPSGAASGSARRGPLGESYGPDSSSQTP